MYSIEFDIIDSTNKFLKENYLKYDDFTFVSANNQTCGKGREQRKWFSNANENLLFSFLLKSEELLHNFNYLSILTSYSIIKVCEEYGINNAMIKWPNDIYINDKKVCGILLEGCLPNYLVIGVGLNVNQTIFNNEYRITPTSLKIEKGSEFNLKELKHKLYLRIEKEFIKAKNNGFKFINAIKKYDYLASTECFINSYCNQKKVKVIGIQDDASLLISDDGKKVLISSGEVFLK